MRGTRNATASAWRTRATRRRKRIERPFSRGRYSSKPQMRRTRKAAPQYSSTFCACPWIDAGSARAKAEFRGDQTALRRDIHKTIRDVSGKNGGRIWAAPQADREADYVSADDRRQKECAEEPACIALSAGAENQVARPQRSPPCATWRCPPRAHKDTQAELPETSRREPAGRLQPAGAREGNAAKTPTTRRRRQPAQRNQQSAAVAAFSVVGANHSESGSLAAKNFVNLGRQLEIQVADALHAVRVQVDHHFISRR